MGNLSYDLRAAEHLRTVVDFKLQQGLEAAQFRRKIAEFTVGYVETLQLAELAYFGREGTEAVAEFAFSYVHRDNCPVLLHFEDFLLAVALVEGNLRDFDIVLHQGPCHRLGQLVERMYHGEILLVAGHPFGASATAFHCRVILDKVHVIVRAQVEFHKLAKLSDCRGEVSPETEIAYVYEGHAAVGVQLHTRLVAPEVRGLVEIPVGPVGPVISKIVPVRAVEGLPDLPEGVVVLDILGGLVHGDRHLNLASGVVRQLEGALFHRRSQFEQVARLVKERVVLNHVLSCPQAHETVTGETGSHIAVFHLILVVEMGGEAGLQSIHIGTDTRGKVAELQVGRCHLVESIFP